ncbi:hypothetical protein IWQ62_000270 [Dispira parvispora]|uniref:Myb-like domain-containing protein n=1 Tax=Dispira parvispora TaxID=1520584 RepID=A0A9W8AXA8_9FUNG|nr:hypothetical protein IWQ62_000270 [Dispira parvispora]
MSALTSLRIDKGQTRFAPKVKARPARKPAKSKEAPPEVPLASGEPTVESTKDQDVSQASSLPSVQHPVTSVTKQAPVTTSGISIAPPSREQVATAHQATQGTPIGAPGTAPTSSKVPGIAIEAPSQKRSTPTKGIAIATPSATKAGTTTRANRAKRSASTPENTMDENGSASKPRSRKTPRSTTKRENSTPKTWEEYLAEPEEDLSHLPIEYFCKFQRRGLPMKSTVEKEWNDYQKKLTSSLKNTTDAPESKGEQTVPQKSTPSSESTTNLEGKSAVKVQPPQEPSTAKFSETSGAPQVRIVNGRVEVNEESLSVGLTQLAQDPEGHANMTIVDESVHGRYINSMTYNKKKPGHVARWTNEETLLFFQLLSRYGSDFNMISAAMGGDRTREQVRNKFRREEKIRPALITRALLNRPISDHDIGSQPLPTFKDLPTPPPTQLSEVPEANSQDSVPADQKPQDEKDTVVKAPQSRKMSLAESEVSDTSPSNGALTKEIKEEIVGMLPS